MMMYGNGAGMLLMSLLWLGVLVVLVWAGFALLQSARAHGGDSSAAPSARPEKRPETLREILDRLYASGDIDSDTYQRMRDRLTDGG